MTAERVAVRLRGDAEGAVAEGARRRRRSARSSTRWPCATSRTSIAEKRVEQDQAYAEAMQKVAEQYPDDLDAAHAVRRRAVPARAAARHARRQRARTSSACTACSKRCWPRTSSIPAPAISTSTPPSRRCVPEQAEACAEFLGKSIPGASHINHMPSHTWNEVGRWGDSVRANLEAWHSDLKADDRRRLRDLSRAQPAHAALRRVDGRPGRDRDAGRARTTRS